MSGMINKNDLAFCSKG